MKRLRFASPGTLSRMFQDAADAWKRQDYQQTIELLQRAAKLDPANPRIHLDLGRAFGLRFDYPAAERCFDQAIRLSPKAPTIAEAGRRSQEFGNSALAARYFDRAASAKDAAPDVLIALAEIHERRAQLGLATDFAQRAAKLDPANQAVQLLLARLDRLSGRPAEAETRVRALLEKTGSDHWLRARAWYELAEILDRTARYDDAFDALLEAKAIIRPAAVNHAATLQRIQARVRQLEESLTAASFQRWAVAADSLAPARRFAILCGHPRSGTTLLEQALASHPDILTSEETHILHDEAYLPLSRGFAPDASVLEILESAPLSRLRESRENYFRFTELFLGQPLGNKLLVDKNPALNVLIPAAVRIFPEAKFLIALRDPRDVCLSCFMQPLAPNPVSSAYLSLEGTVTQYLSVMGFWRALLPRLANPFLEVRYENVVENLAGESRKVLAFLGAPWDDHVLRFDEQARKRLLRSPSYAEVAKPLTKRAIGRWQNYRRHLEPHLASLDPMLKALNYA